MLCVLTKFTPQFLSDSLLLTHPTFYVLLFQNPPKPVCAPQILGCGAYPEARSAYQGSHPKQKLTLLLPAALNCQQLLSQGRDFTPTSPFKKRKLFLTLISLGVFHNPQFVINFYVSLFKNKRLLLMQRPESVSSLSMETPLSKLPLGYPQSPGRTHSASPS